TWIMTCNTYCCMPVARRNGTAASSTTSPMPMTRARREVTEHSAATGQDAARPREDHDDEDDEGDHVAHLGRPHHARDRDDLAHDERRDEGSQHVPEPAEHADHERQRPELAAEERMDRVLEDQQRAGE